MKLSYELLAAYVIENFDKETKYTRFFNRDTLDANRSFSRIELLPSTNAENLSLETIWFGAVEKIIAMPAYARKDLFFLTGSTADQVEKLEAIDTGSVLCVVLDEDPAVVFNAVIRMWSELENWGKQMDLAAAKHEPLQTILDLTEPILNNPIFIWDTYFRMLARPKIPLEEGSPLAKLAEQDIISGDILNKFLEAGGLQDASKYVSFTMGYLPNYGNAPYYIRSYCFGANPCFTVIQYFTNIPASPMQKSLLDLFDTKLQEYVLINYSNESRGDYYKNRIYEPFLLGLISGRIGDAEIVDHLNFINWDYNAPYRMYAIAVEDFVPSVGYYIKANTKSFLPTGKVVGYEEQVYILLRLTSEDAYKEDFFMINERMQRFLETVNGWCGASTVFENLAGVKYAAEQAARTLRIGKMLNKNKRLWGYQEVFFEDMALCHIKNNKLEPTQQTVLKKLLLLREMDQKHNNDNLQLLDVFLNEERNATKTARKMNLHRNSVIYRIQKIEELLEVSFESSQTRFDFLIAFKYMKVLNLFNSGKTKDFKSNGNAVKG